MQLKDDFRLYEALRREHDSQIVQIASEAGLRISPEQWSSLLYGDTVHKSHMQSIIDKVPPPLPLIFSLKIPFVYIKVMVLCVKHAKPDLSCRLTCTEQARAHCCLLQLQTPQSLSQGISELEQILRRAGDPARLLELVPHLKMLADIDPEPGTCH